MRARLEGLHSRAGAEQRLKELIRELAPFHLGREPGAWMYWRDLGLWAESPDRPPPMPQGSHRDATMGMEAQVVVMGDLDEKGPVLTPQLASSVVELVYTYPTDGRSWLTLGRVLEKEELREAALAAYREGLARTPKQDILQWATLTCEGLVQALHLVEGHDLHRDWHRWVASDRVSQNGWKALRNVLRRDDPVLLKTMLREGADFEPSARPEHARHQLGVHLRDDDNDAPAARAEWERAVALYPGELDSTRSLVEYFRDRGDLSQVARRIAALPGNELEREIVTTMSDGPSFTMEAAGLAPRVPLDVLRIVLHCNLEAHDAVQAKLQFVLHAGRIRKGDPASMPLWLEYLGTVGASPSEFSEVRDRLRSGPISWRLWSEATGALATPGGEAWMEATMRAIEPWHDADRHMARALWTGRCNRWSESLDELAAALSARTALPAPSTGLLVDVVARPLWAAALGRPVEFSTIQKARSLSIPENRAWPGAYRRAVTDYLVALRAGRYREAGAIAERLFDYEPQEPIWSGSVVLAAWLDKRPDLASKTLDRFAMACRSHCAGLWAVRQLRGIVR